MNRAPILSAVLLSSTLATGRAQDPVESPQIDTVQELVAEIGKREKVAKSAVIEMETTGRFPDGSRFRSSGSLRVLGTTHVRSFRSATFGDGLEAETETVMTPDGLHMREKDPVQGEVFTFMKPELMHRLQSARDHLGASGTLGGLPSRPTDAPLGSAVIEGMNRSFDLRVSGPRPIPAAGGQRCWVVGGPARAGLDDSGQDLTMGADYVDILVRERDAAVIRMTQLKEGEPIIEVRITKLELNRPLGEDDFRLDIPPKARIVDVMDHPPARAQIDGVLEQAREAGWKDPAQKK